MFTGIIEGLGTIRAIGASGQGSRLSIAADFSLADSRIGDSIAVNGACLTAVSIDGPVFSADVSAETLARTALAGARTGDRVNLERAMRLSDRLDGHLVSGHVDGIGTIQRRSTVGNSVAVTVAIPRSIAVHLIEKGSIAVDGISLTINACTDESFTVSIIPHTAEITTIGLKPIGAAVNIETDLIGKYVERFLDRKTDRAPESSPALDRDFLVKTGFI